MRHTVSVVIRSSDPKRPAHNTTGIAPTPTSPLAVTRLALWVEGKWVEQAQWCITHRPTGFRLFHGDRGEFDTSTAAYRALMECDPDFPGWSIVKGLRPGSKPDPAMAECWSRFSKAVGAQRA